MCVYSSLYFFAFKPEPLNGIHEIRYFKVSLKFVREFEPSFKSGRSNRHLIKARLHVSVAELSYVCISKLVDFKDHLKYIRTG